MNDALPTSAIGTFRTKPDVQVESVMTGHVRLGRVEDGRGSLGHSATLRFPSPLIEPDVPD